VTAAQSADTPLGDAEGMVTVTGDGRGPADIVAELMDVLADDPHVVECDLAGMAAEGRAIVDEFAQVGDYLGHWSGSTVLMHVPDPGWRAALDAAYADRLLIHASSAASGTESKRLLPPLHRWRTRLTPSVTAPQQARSSALHTLQGWLPAEQVATAGQVVSALVTHAVVHAPSELDLMLSRVDERIRIAVRDHDEPVLAAAPIDGAALWLDYPDRHLVQACTAALGVIPARSAGKTVWAVLRTEGDAP
jgi:hypothetical protein